MLLRMISKIFFEIKHFKRIFFYFYTIICYEKKKIKKSFISYIKKEYFFFKYDIMSHKINKKIDHTFERNPFF